jgi:hypothetical protein
LKQYSDLVHKTQRFQKKKNVLGSKKTAVATGKLCDNRLLDENELHSIAEIGR